MSSQAYENRVERQMKRVRTMSEIEQLQQQGASRQNVNLEIQRDEARNILILDFGEPIQKLAGDRNQMEELARRIRKEAKKLR